jgi:hypothetical protein
LRECLRDDQRGPCQCEAWGPDAGDWKGGVNPQEGVTVLKLPATEVRPDPTADVLYVTIGNLSPEHRDSFVALAPDGSVLWATELGGAPHAIAVSTDGSLAHVGVRETPAVAQLDLSTRQETARSPVPPFANLPAIVYTMEPVPGNAEQVLAVYGGSALFSTIGAAALLENCVQLGATTPLYVSADRIAVADASTAYAYDASSTGGTFYTLALSSAGVTVVTQTMNAIDDFARNSAYDGEWMFTSLGQAVDPPTHTVVGTYPQAGPIVSNRAADRVYVASVDDSGAIEIAVFDRDGFAELGRLSIQDIGGIPLRITQSRGGTLALLVDSIGDQVEADHWIVLVSPTVLPGG